MILTFPLTLLMGDTLAFILNFCRQIIQLIVPKSCILKQIQLCLSKDWVVDG